MTFLRSRLDWHILGRSDTVVLRLSRSFMHRGSRLGQSCWSLVDRCRCLVRLVHGGRACSVLLVGLLLAASGTTRSPEQAPKHTRRGRLLLSLTIGNTRLSSDLGGFVLLPAEGSEQRCTALLLNGVRSRGTSRVSRARSGCLEVPISGRYRSGRTAAGGAWGPSCEGRLLSPLLDLLFSFNLLLLL